MSVVIILTLLGCVIAAQSLSPSPLPQGEPADEGLAGPGEVEASPSLPRPVVDLDYYPGPHPFANVDEDGWDRTPGQEPRYVGDDIEFESLWGDS